MPGDILARIVRDKQLAAARRCASLTQIRMQAADAPPPRPFAAALSAARGGGKFPVIAEIKRRSPSRGVLRRAFCAAELARGYQQGGAACLSVLTDAPYFGGDNDDLRAARAACDLPILRKDFLLDEWQIYESRAIGADAVLLIAAVLSEAQIQQLSAAAAALHMAVLIELHDDADVQKALAAPEAIVGINNRDLNTFAVSLRTTLELLPLVRKSGRPRFVVSESGIAARDDIATLSAAGADGFLIGESFMRAEDPGAALKKLFENC